MAISNNNSFSESLSYSGKKLSSWLKDNKKFWFGAGAVVLGLAVLPGFKKGLKPVAVKVVQGTMMIADKSKEVIESTRRSIDDISKNAQEIHQKKYNTYGTMPNEIDASIIEELKIQRDMAVSEIQMLKEQLNDLYIQINSIKKGVSSEDRT